MLLGTATDGSDPNFIVQAEVRVPQPSFEVDPIVCETYSGTFSVVAIVPLPGATTDDSVVPGRKAVTAFLLLCSCCSGWRRCHLKVAVQCLET